MINIFREIFLRARSICLSGLNKKLRNEFVKIRQEFEEHLQAINENTNEIASNYEYICELESRLDKLSERLEYVHMTIESSGNFAGKRGNFEAKKLNRVEQRVFLAIYTLEEKGYVTYADIAKELNISEQLAGSYVTSLIGKGIPIMKKYINSKPYLKLEPEFKTLQIKENILQLGLEEFGF